MHQNAYRRRESVLSHTRMKKQLMDVSRKRQREIRKRKAVMGLAAFLLLILAAVLWQAARGSNQTAAPAKNVQLVKQTAQPEDDKATPRVKDQTASNANREATPKPKEPAVTKAKSKAIPKPKEPAATKAQSKATSKPNKPAVTKAQSKAKSKPKEPAATKAKSRATPKPKTPSLKLQEDDHVAGSLEAME